MRGPNDILRGATILVAEDDAVLAWDYQAAIEECGAHVVGPFSTGREAIEALHRPIGAALVDHVLSDGPSNTLQAELQAREIPFVVLTGYPRVLVKNEDVSATILNKPIAASDLCRALTDICSMRLEKR